MSTITLRTTTTMYSPTDGKRRGSWVPSRRKSQCSLEISIDRHFEAKIYTSGSTVTGHVILASQVDLTLDDLDVSFRGAASTSIEMLHQGSMPKSGHRFLRLKMPISEPELPVNRLLQGGSVYKVPFSFAIPYQLSSATCEHHSAMIRERHLQPPPTIGSWEHDDMAIHSISIQYAVEARSVFTTDNKPKLTALEKRHIIKVMPFFREEPPLHINTNNTRYELSREKPVRKNIFCSTLGYLRAATNQPSAVTLSPDKLRPSSCSLFINLEFWPTAVKGIPPDIHAKSANIRVSTYYSTGHIGFLPDQHDYPADAPNPTLRFVLDEKATISQSRKSTWERKSPSSSVESSQEVPDHPNIDLQTTRIRTRHDSKSSDSNHMRCPKLTSLMTLVITLPDPDRKIFLPTFYSCLVSRTYILEAVLAVGSHGSSLALRVPLQIAVDGSNALQSLTTPTYEQAEADQEFNNMLPTYEASVR